MNCLCTKHYNKRLRIIKIYCIMLSDKAVMLFGLAARSLVHRRAGIYPAISFTVKGNPLKSDKTLSILIDKSGDFGKFDSKDPKYHVVSIDKGTYPSSMARRHTFAVSAMNTPLSRSCGSVALINKSRSEESMLFTSVCSTIICYSRISRKISLFGSHL